MQILIFILYEILTEWHRSLTNYISNCRLYIVVLFMYFLLLLLYLYHQSVPKSIIIIYTHYHQRLSTVGYVRVPAIVMYMYSKRSSIHHLCIYIIYPFRKLLSMYHITYLCSLHQINDISSTSTTVFTYPTTTSSIYRIHVYTYYMC